MPRILKYTLVLFFAAIIVFGGFMIAVFAVTKPVVFTQKTATLTATTGTVEIEKAGTTAWIPVTVSVEVASGDSVRTGVGGTASVNYFDQGVARLDTNTTIRFDDLSWNPNRPLVWSGRVALASGQLWSRLFDFVTPESIYEVKSSSLVATVRGTAFNMEARTNKEGVYVSNHKVRVHVPVIGNSQSDVDLSTDERMVIDLTKPITVVPQAIRGLDPAEPNQAAWLKSNVQNDVMFEQDVKKRLRQEAAEARMIAPDSSLYNFVPMAERMRLAMTGNPVERQSLASAFAAGHMIDAYRAETDGDARRAAIILNESRTEGSGEADANPLLDRALLFFAHGETSIDPSVLEGIKQDSPRGGEILNTILDRRELFDALLVPATGNSDVTTENSIINSTETIISKPSFDSGTSGTSLGGLIIQPNVPVTSPTTNPVSEPLITTPPPIFVFVPTLELVTRTSNLSVGDRAPIQVLYQQDADTHVDVTNEVRWNVSVDEVSGLPAGIMEGNTFVSNTNGGKATITATYTTTTQTVKGSVVITVLAFQ